MRPAPAARQRGATLVLFALFALVMLGFMALAVDLGRAYNRRLEMQNLADAAALGGAGALNGTAAGIDAALLRAQQRTALMRYDYRRTPA
ncbi:MAG TPA: pilus assembly protein TadG-related protein, partial [Burkholderiaceae bacterium]